MLKRSKLIACAIASLIASLIFEPSSKAFAYDSSIDYKTALKDSIIFYDANKCGCDVSKDNAFNWRGSCHINDGDNLGIDLTGGYHDAGDFVKFGLPQSYSASVMGWALNEFKDGFSKADMVNKQLEQLKYFTDYLLKCHYADGKFVYQVGDGYKDHDYWAAPEKQSDAQGGRDTVLVADSSHPASDILGEASAALSIMYLNYKDIDIEYADKCLNSAKELYEMGKSNPGKADVSDFYVSSHYNDDLAWAAAWLYDATKNESYLKDSKELIVKDSPWLDSNWTMCWDNMTVPVTLKLYELTKDEIYKKSMDYNMNCWKNMKTVDGGLKVLNEWGSLRYSASASMLALIYNKYNKNEDLTNLAESQIDYILGKNPSNMSYVAGFGDKWPKHLHHRAANGYDKRTDGNYKELSNKYVLTGALAGGPDGNGIFEDVLDKYQYTEVAIDYNAGLVGALAGYVSLYCTQDEHKTIGDVNDDGVVDLSDYTLLRRYINGNGQNVKINEINADINEDSIVDFFDLVALKDLI